MRRVYRLIILGLVGASGAGLLSLAKGTSAGVLAQSETGADHAIPGAFPVDAEANAHCLPQPLAAEAATVAVRKGDRIAATPQVADARLVEQVLAGADISQCAEGQSVTLADEDMQQAIGSWELRL